MSDALGAGTRFALGAALLLGDLGCVGAGSSVGRAVGSAIAQSAVNGLARPEAPHTCVAEGTDSASCGRTPEYLERITYEYRSPTDDPPFDDSCAGMCLSTETCVVYRGDLDCVPR